MKTTILNFSKVVLMALTIFSIYSVTSCSKEGQVGPQGAAGTSVTGANAISVFTTISTTANRSTNIIVLDNPATNSKPNALLFVTHDFDLGGSATYLNKPIGVFYGPTSFPNKWCIYIEEQTTFPLGIKLNVMVFNQ